LQQNVEDIAFPQQSVESAEKTRKVLPLSRFALN
jgi:hypothetical protein